MELWVTFSIMTALLWATLDIINKFIFTKWPVKPVVLVIFSSLINLSIASVIYVTQGLSIFSEQNIILSIAAALFYLLGYLFYFRAVKLEEVSRVTPLFYIFPLFILILAAIFFQEKFIFIKYMGIVLLVAGAVLISQKESFNLRFGKTFWLMVLSALSIAINAIITKHLLGFADYWTVFSYTRGIGLLPFLIPLIYKKIPDLRDAARFDRGTAVGAIAGSISLNSAGVVLVTLAMAIGPVTLVNSLVSVQPLFVFFFALFISKYYPKIFKEDLNRRTVMVKFVSILLICIGAIMIT